MSGGPKMIVVPPDDKSRDWKVVFGDLVHPGTVFAEVDTSHEADDICVRLAMTFRVPARTFWPYEPEKVEMK